MSDDKDVRHDPGAPATGDGGGSVGGKRDEGGGELVVGTFGPKARPEVAKFSKGARVGRLPPVPQEFGGPAALELARISSAFLANYAEIRDGVFSAIGCGWSTYLVDEFPSHVQGCLVLIAEANEGDSVASTTEFGFELVDPDAKVVTQTQLSFTTALVSQGGRSLCIVSFVAAAKGPGTWEARVLGGGEETARVGFEVKRRGAVGG